MSLPAQIRDSLAAGDFVRAARQYEEHTFQLRVALQARRCNRSAIEEARELLEIARAARDRLRDRLLVSQRRAYVAGAYRGGCLRP